jgi:hypothetical protein
MLSAATGLALLAAIAAFIALKPGESDTAEDPFIRAANRLCVQEKQRVQTLEQETLQQQQDVGSFAGALTTVVAEWHSRFQKLPTPPPDAREADAFGSALLDVAIRAGALARVAHERRLGEIADKAKLVDVASRQVDRQVEQLGLDECASVRISGLRSTQ